MKSEKLFEVFCERGRIPCRRLSPDCAPTPDYEITIAGTRTYVEIKELTPNADEEKVVGEWEAKRGTGEFVTWGDTIGRRVRREIESARRQIKRLAAGKSPGVLLLYDARPPPFTGIEPHEIEAAMYGPESIDLHVSKEPGEPVRFGRHRFGKGKKCRHDSHTYISAIGLLRELHLDGKSHIDLYHNIHADPKHALPLREIVARNDMTVFTLAPGKGDEYRGWARMVTEKEYSEVNKTLLGPAETAAR